MSEEQKELAVVYKIDDNEIRLTPNIVQNYLVGSNTKITLGEFKLFTELCKVRKLNPFLKEAYIIKYGSNPATIVVGKDVIIKRAVLHPQYDGKESGIIVMNDAGEITERNGCFASINETIVGGWARVYRKDRAHAEYMSVSLSEVASKKGTGEFNSTWMNQTATMVEKVAKVRALREAFVDDLQGLYDIDEMNNQTPEPLTEPIKDAEFEVLEPKQVNLDEV